MSLQTDNLSIKPEQTDNLTNYILPTLNLQVNQ